MKKIILLRVQKSLVCLLFGLILVAQMVAQFSGRYPMLKNYSHHHYFEGYDLPVMGTGPSDPVAIPGSEDLIFSAKGFLWRYSLQSGIATQLTNGANCDLRPAVSADGLQLAFVRDNTLTLEIVVKDLASGREEVLVHTGKIDTDPAFSKDGKWLYYSSSTEGDMDLWRIDRQSKQTERLTSDAGLELSPQPLPDGKKVVYVSKARSGMDFLMLLDIETKEKTVLRGGHILSQLRPSLSPDGRFVAICMPDEYRKQESQVDLIDLTQPTAMINLTQDRKLAFAPAWSADQRYIYFIEANQRWTFQLFRVPVVGGKVESLPDNGWQWRQKMAVVRIKTYMEGKSEALPTRLNVLDGQGHPLFAEGGNPHLDSQNGIYYFHSPGEMTVFAPVGEVKVTATYGLTALPVSGKVVAKAGEETEIKLNLKRLWDPAPGQWLSGDLHFHLNYGGTYYLKPEHLVLPMQAEDLDVGAPMTANLNNRPMDSEYIGWRREALPIIDVAQEVRSHFLGHVGMIKMKSWFMPWFFGPGYPIYGQMDLDNGTVLKAGRDQGAFTIYVHPIGRVPDPFVDEKSLASIPTNLVADAVLGNFDSLETACLMTNDLGNHELWYRLLNLGLPIVATGGTDTFTNYYRNLIVGSTRIYAKVPGEKNYDNFLQAIRDGRSFTTTGPLVEFSVDGKEAGDVLKTGVNSLPWKLNLFSPTAVEKVEIMVNGQVVYTAKGLSKPGTKSYSGKVQIPVGGWVAARIYGGAHPWPLGHTVPFAHTAPIWIGEKHSVEPQAALKAAQDLLRALDVARAKVDTAYPGEVAPYLKSQFTLARQKLTALIEQYRIN